MDFLAAEMSDREGISTTPGIAQDHGKSRKSCLACKQEVARKNWTYTEPRRRQNRTTSDVQKARSQFNEVLNRRQRAGFEEYAY